MKNCTAYPLFVLYRALKYRTESGPIDALNGLSHFSLNCNNVLQENVKFDFRGGILPRMNCIKMISKELMIEN